MCVVLQSILHLTIWPQALEEHQAWATSSLWAELLLRTLRASHGAHGCAACTMPSGLPLSIQQYNSGAKLCSNCVSGLLPQCAKQIMFWQPEHSMTQAQLLPGPQAGFSAVQQSADSVMQWLA